MGLAVNDTRVSRIDRRVEKPETERCLKYKSDPSLSGPCNAAKIEAGRYLQTLETGAEVCLENTFGEPIKDCYARGVVIDPTAHATIVSITEVDSAHAKNFRNQEYVWFDNDALVDLYLAEHGY
jgi:hypothetical protein